MSKCVAALLLTVALLFTAALAQEDTMDWTDYEAVQIGRASCRERV